MTGHSDDKVFAGSIPELYDSLLVPLIFEPYAADLVTRLAARRPERLLELACGTGVVTRAIAAAFSGASIVASDLNQSMLDQAMTHGAGHPVEWRLADALDLPFADATFDTVVCQFGVMFFPDKARAFAEARRILRPGGQLIFSSWDRIEENEFADVVTTALETYFPDDPPRFMARTPHGYHDRETLARDIAAGGFSSPATIVTVAARSRAPSCDLPAVAYCQGTPLRNEILARNPVALTEATAIAAEAIGRQFGRGPVDGKIQAHVVTVDR